MRASVGVSVDAGGAGGEGAGGGGGEPDGGGAGEPTGAGASADELPPPQAKSALVAAITQASEDPKWKAFVQGKGLTGGLMTGPPLDRFIDSDIEALRVTMQSLGLLVR